MCNVKCVIHESRVNHSSGEAARAFTEGWILFPDVPRSADSAALSEEMAGHPGKEGSTGAIYQEIWETRRELTPRAEPIIINNKIKKKWQRSR